MKSFTDAAGRSWGLSVNVTSMQRVKDELSVDLMEMIVGDGDLMGRMDRDPCLFCNVIFVLIKPEADKAGVTDAQFGEAMYGDFMNGAAEAFADELMDFPRAPELRKNLRTTHEKAEKLRKRGAELIAKKLENPEMDSKLTEMLEEEMDKAVNNILREMGGVLSGNSPGPSE